MAGTAPGRRAAALGLAASLAPAAVPVRAQASAGLDATVADALRRMGGTLAAAPRLTVRFTQLREEAARPHGGQMLMFGATIAVGISRPSRLAALVGSDRGNYRLWFDGNTLTLLNLTENAYARAAVTGGIEDALAAQEVHLGVDIPLRDLLAANPFAALTEPGTTGRRVGRTVVNGDTCEHFALRNRVVDWQIWIAADGPALPCRLVVTDREEPDMPRTILDFQHWDLGAELDASTFAFDAPDGATEVPWLPRRPGATPQPRMPRP